MMVCTLLEPRLDELKDAIRELDPLADAFEIRLDALTEDTDPRAIRRLTTKPLIATCRRTTENGAFNGPEHDRLAMLETCIHAGFEYADVEGPTTLPAPEERLIRSRHEKRATPSVATIVRMAQESGRNGALFKFAAPTHSFADVLTMLSAARQLSSEHRRFALMGLGDFPRALLHLWGSAFTYGGGRTTAPGQPPLEEIRRTLTHWGAPSAARNPYLVVGDPVHHSLSPRIHNAGFRLLGLDAAYGALRVPTGLELQMLLEAAPRIGLAGLSVTTPLKDAAFENCERRTPEEEAAHAVNCIRLEPEGPIGHNTDGLGARRVVEELLPNTHGRILLAGTGGAARAIASQLKGQDLTIAGRRDEHLAPLAERFGARAVPLLVAAANLRDYDLIINATRSLEPFPVHGYQGALFDLHYEAARTPWERYATESHLPAAGGRELLLEQGVAAFEFWTGKTAPADEMRKALEDGP